MNYVRFAVCCELNLHQPHIGLFWLLGLHFMDRPIIMQDDLHYSLMNVLVLVTLVDLRMNEKVCKNDVVSGTNCTFLYWSLFVFLGMN